ncbi:hypothetical protein [Lacticaseibacillus brantae]|uniref:WxL domain-containing protein n=1 Tax=Lacticaseibacillus brantae DSM 23927 TaxID=1423727 RepID=A0A0R2B053_9LACO|nr:hypothetical protein [Lacticaseibacillus brantae]KRM72961.1 hypothetical protein FC34_GL000675 [Lacticaseibacillus brantae DSM 23927]
MFNPKFSRLTVLAGILWSTAAFAAPVVNAERSDTLNTLGEIGIVESNSFTVQKAPYLKFASANLDKLQDGEDQTLALESFTVNNEGYHTDVEGNSDVADEIVIKNNTEVQNWSLSVEMTDFINDSTTLKVESLNLYTDQGDAPLKLIPGGSAKNIVTGGREKKTIKIKPTTSNATISGNNADNLKINVKDTDKPFQARITWNLKDAPAGEPAQ